MTFREPSAMAESIDIRLDRIPCVRALDNIMRSSTMSVLKFQDTAQYGRQFDVAGEWMAFTMTTPVNQQSSGGANAAGGSGLSCGAQRWQRPRASSSDPLPMAGDAPSAMLPTPDAIRILSLLAMKRVLLRPPKLPVAEIAFSPYDQSLLAAAAADGSAFVWQFFDNKEPSECEYVQQA